MNAASEEKWPVEIQVVKISSHNLNPEMDTFFITGLMNQAQHKTLQAKLTILAKFWVDADRVVISTMIQRQQLAEKLEHYKELSKSWRGQYQVLMKVLSRACEDALHS